MSGITPYLRALSDYPWAPPEEYDGELEAFLRLLSDRLPQSVDLVNARRWRDIVALWAPVFHSRLLDPSHAEWADKPWHRAYARLALLDLLTAHIQSNFGAGEGASPARNEAAWSLIYLKRLLEEQSSAPDQDGLALSDEATEVSKRTLILTLELARQWFDDYGDESMAVMSGMPDVVVNHIHQRLRARL